MDDLLKIKSNEDFRPAPQLKKLYYIYLIIGFCVSILFWYLPMIMFFSPRIAILSILIPIFIVYWIPKYYFTIFYKLTENEIVWKRGVWFKQMGIVSYNRITNIDIIQGPISRKLGIAALKIQTAGYSGQQSGAEIKIEGIEQFNELRDFIMEFIRIRKPVAVETYDENDINFRILNELEKIRKLLDKS